MHSSSSSSSSSEALRPAQGHRKPLGKLASRLEEVKSSWRQSSSLELSHNEAARLAVDALMERGEGEYHRVLREERELNFLSPLELSFITQQHAARAQESNGTNDRYDHHGDEDCVSELTSGTYFPMMSDEDPPLLELGWPEASSRYGPSETQIYFQRDKTHNVKDLIRGLINKAKKVIAVVMDVFTDVDLLCDLMEASNKRRVPVYILLDGRSIEHFTDMCSALDIHNSHLTNMRIRTVCGDTYCTKSGKKFTGQVLEKFIIIDCDEVIAGSYSFTWLSAQVHSNMMMHFSGRIADSFDREFRCLYADSEVIPCFSHHDDEGTPCYPSYHTQALTQGIMGLDLLQDSRHLRERERVASEHSSSQSSNSVSSVKVSPAMTSGNTVYKVTQSQPHAHTHAQHAQHANKDALNMLNPLNPLTKDPYSNALTKDAYTKDKLLNTSANNRQSPDRRMNFQQQGGQGQTTTNNPATLTTRANNATASGNANNNGGNGTGTGNTSAYGQTGIEWSKSNPAEMMRNNIMTPNKFQALGLYDHKPSMFHHHHANLSPNINLQSATQRSQSHMTPKSQQQQPQQLNQTQITPKGQTQMGTKGTQAHQMMTPKGQTQQQAQKLSERTNPKTQTEKKTPSLTDTTAKIDKQKTTTTTTTKTPGATNQLFNKLTDLFLPSSSSSSSSSPSSQNATSSSNATTTTKTEEKEKSTTAFNFRNKTPSPQGTAVMSSTWGGPALSLGEPESEQSPPPPLSPAAVMNRHEAKRLTLGHSKLDLITNGNKKKNNKQVYSRFELKTAD